MIHGSDILITTCAKCLVQVFFIAITLAAWSVIEPKVCRACAEMATSDGLPLHRV
jgi:hypothetical protein